MQNDRVDSEEEDIQKNAVIQIEESKQSDNEIEVNHAQMIKMLMLSKDDNLLLQMTCLFLEIVNCDFLDEKTKETQIPKLLEIVHQIFPILCSDIPIRNFSLRYFARTLIKSQQPVFNPNEE